MLNIADVSKTYRVTLKNTGRVKSQQELLALSNINLSVKDGEFVSVVGPSGCGKTTLLKLVAGLMSPDEGEIVINGFKVMGPHQHVSMVFQNIALMPWRTAQKNVELGLELKFHRSLKDEDRETARKYLNMVGLSSFENAYPSQLSGGMQQRVGLARALVKQPEVLLMDEPFGALDAQTRSDLQDELLTLMESFKIPIIFITHDLEEAIYLSDRVVIMTNRPGMIKSVLEVDLPAKRYSYDARGDQRFIQLRREASELLRAERRTVG